MSRLALPLAILAAGALLGPMGAQAQTTDPAALSIIERLKPKAGTTSTRGIRLPSSSADSAASSPSPPSASAASAAPSLTAPVTPSPALTTPPPARVAAARPPVPATTTAPADVPAVSITVQFPTGSATLSPQAEQALAPLGRALASPDLAPYRFRIEGHTDTVGTAEYNQALSLQRAEAVRAFLQAQYKVPASRLEAVGLGKSELLVKTGDNVAEQRNRRVQVVNVGS